MAIDTNVTAPVTAPVNVTGAPVTNTIANHAEKPEKFNGQNFKRWQQKIFLYLTTLNLARFLNENTQPSGEPPTGRLQRIIGVGSRIACSVYSDIHAEEMDHAGSSSKSNSKAKGKGKKKNDKKGKGKAEYLAPKARIMKQKFQGTCYNCELAMSPRTAKMQDAPKRVIHARLICGWLVDTRATHHVCVDKSMFHSFARAVENREVGYSNSATADHQKAKGDGYSENGHLEKSSSD
ncbi:hypothetical protein Tco_1097661 [Tanacetum coccineum]